MQVDQAIWADVKSLAHILQFLYPGLPAVAAHERLEAVWPDFKKRPGNTIAGGAKYYANQAVKGSHATVDKVNAGLNNAKKGHFKW